MHPLGMYLAITSSDREQQWADEDERAVTLARAEARTRVAPEPGRRIGRLTAILRRRRFGTARA